MEGGLDNALSSVHLQEICRPYRDICIFTVVSDAICALERIAFTTFDLVIVDREQDCYPADRFALTLRRLGIQIPVIQMVSRPCDGICVVEASNNLIFSTLFRPFGAMELFGAIDLATGAPLAVARVSNSSSPDSDRPTKRRPDSRNSSVPSGGRLPSMAVPVPAPVPVPADRPLSGNPMPMGMPNGGMAEMLQLLQVMQLTLQQCKHLQQQHQEQQEQQQYARQEQYVQPVVIEPFVSDLEMEAYQALLGGQSPLSASPSPVPFPSALLPPGSPPRDAIRTSCPPRPTPQSEQRLLDAFEDCNDLFGREDPYFDAACDLILQQDEEDRL